MEALTGRRKAIKAKLTRMKKKVLDPAARTLSSAKLYKEQLDQLRADYQQLHVEILASCPSAEEEEYQRQYDDACDVMDEMGLSIIQTFDGSSRQSNIEQPHDVNRNEVTVKLPKLDLPKFSGNLLEWTTFYDLFKSNVHEHPTLDGAQKLQYLKSLVTGPAAELLQPYQITNANYVEAWEVLQKRYKNTRELVKTQIARFVNMPFMKKESGANLARLADVAMSVARALKALERPIYDKSDLAIYMITTRLDPETLKLWESKLGRESLPKLSELLKFLDERAAILSAAEVGNETQYSNQSKPTNNSGVRKMAQAHQINAAKYCVLCKADDHYIYGCKQFNDMKIDDRRVQARELGLCFNCLRTGHTSVNCQSESRCKKCKQIHHTSLHIETTNNSDTVSAHTAGHSGEGNRALLATALVTVTDDFGRRHNVRALIDPGADVSFASERCVQLIGLKRKKTNVELSGLGNNSVGTAKGLVQLKLGSRFEEDFQLETYAYVLPKLTGILPKLPCVKEEISHLTTLPLADPRFYQPGSIDLLLGSEVFFNCLRHGHVNVGKDLPVALETVFGWIVGGSCPSQNFEASATVNLVCSDSRLEALLEWFWTVEELPNKPILTCEENLCENNFLASTTREPDGRFTVELPFKPNAPPLGASREMAVRRLKHMERKFFNDPVKKQKYIDVIKETMEMGHLELVPEEDLRKPDTDCCYLPHHAVMKESSTTTQLLVVYDASAKTKSGCSLNDVLITGPKLQDDLFVILVRFRMHIVAFVADISNMFRQIWVVLHHRDFQRIVRRESPDQPIRDYRLTTVTFGESSAPYLAKRCLKKLAEDNAETYPLASPIALRDFYMDDLMSGHSNLETAYIIQDEILSLLDSACMPLRKWSSNSKELLERLEPSMREITLPLRIDEDDAVKTLGLYWLPASDQFTFKVNVPPFRSVITKRTLSSDSARTFDPLGFISPVTLLAKLMLQSVWGLKMDWDDPIPGHIAEEWYTYRSNLTALEKLYLNRCIKPCNDSPYELFRFSDASERAMGAVVYMRSKLENGEYSINLIAAKTKLAPLKQISIPRLELNGAVMLTKLINVLYDCFANKPDRINVFTDSSVVLAWLAKHPKKWDTFVANRVALIQESLSFESWHHVAGTENPADCASRGMQPTEFLQHSLWWNGPEWLNDPMVQFKEGTLDIDMAAYEAKREVTVHHVVQDMWILHDISTLTKLIRVTAYLLRFVKNLRPCTQPKSRSFISSLEINNALMFWVRRIQANVFPAEMSSCRAGNPLAINSRLRCLNPFIDENGILRVGGRLRHAKTTDGRRNPILLPNKHYFTSLVIMHEHNKYLHGGSQSVLASIQRRFWIINGRDAVRRQIKQCIICTRFRADMAHQIMSDLPQVRVNPQRPFLKAGIDYAGPFQLRTTRGKGCKKYKGYIALFICMVTKAVHLEVVTSLLSQAFVACLKRFIARRGIPSDLYSDCATNFVGADNELRQTWTSSEFINDVGTFMGQKQIYWHFNPPASPNFGGIWEAGIKSLKHHLVRAMGLNIFTYEDMQTVTCQIEACLNSRPLTQLSTDPNDLLPLTPGHFLIGDALTAIPEQDLTTDSESEQLYNRWKLMQRLVQHFWKRWSWEYLSTLQQRPKWLSKRPVLQVGDLVLLKDERYPPLKWKMARIVEAHPGADGLPRVFTIRTPDGIARRPITKLCPLPIDPPTND